MKHPSAFHVSVETTSFLHGIFCKRNDAFSFSPEHAEGFSFSPLKKEKAQGPVGLVGSAHARRRRKTIYLVEIERVSKGLTKQLLVIPVTYASTYGWFVVYDEEGAVAFGGQHEVDVGPRIAADDAMAEVGKGANRVPRRLLLRLAIVGPTNFASQNRLEFERLSEFYERVLQRKINQFRLSKAAFGE